MPKDYKNCNKLLLEIVKHKKVLFFKESKMKNENDFLYLLFEILDYSSQK